MYFVTLDILKLFELNNNLFALHFYVISSKGHLDYEIGWMVDKAMKERKERQELGNGDRKRG